MDRMPLLHAYHGSGGAHFLANFLQNHAWIFLIMNWSFKARFNVLNTKIAKELLVKYGPQCANDWVELGEYASSESIN